MSLTGGLFNSGLFKGRLFNGGPATGTPSDYIKISPHVAAAIGAKVWKWA